MYTVRQICSLPSYQVAVKHFHCQPSIYNIDGKKYIKHSTPEQKDIHLGKKDNIVDVLEQVRRWKWTWAGQVTSNKLRPH